MKVFTCQKWSIKTERDIVPSNAQTPMQGYVDRKELGKYDTTRNINLK